MRKRVCGEGNSRDEEGHVGIENIWRGEGVRRPGRGVIVILLSDGYRYFQASNPCPSLHGVELSSARDDELMGQVRMDPSSVLRASSGGA